MPDEVAQDAGPARPSVARAPYRAAVLTTAAVVLIAGLGAGGWFLLNRHTSPAQAANRQGAQQTGPAGSQASGGSPVGEGSPALGATDPAGGTPSGPASSAPTPSQETSQTGPVAVAAPVTGNAQAGPVAAFLGEYFDAINGHDYQAYVALRSPQAASVSQSEFDAGYRSTTDVGETLQAISTAASGDLIADVTFTSDQNAADSASKSACTNWNISLYLGPDGDGGYLIDDPPAGYHARYASCG
jgi:hypothetical protein